MYYKNMTKARVVDFFCGAGGFSEGFSQAGFEVIRGIDNWAPAIKTHNINHRLNDQPMSVLDFEDITKIHELPDSEVIVGSPPCVSFSTSNKGGNADKALGIRLIEAYLRVVAVKKHQKDSILEAWLMENVPNSKNFVKEYYTFGDLNLGDWSESIGKKPSDIALNVKENGDVLKASDYGAAQARNRYVCGEIVNSGFFPMPIKSEKETTVSQIRTSMPAPLDSNFADNKITDPNYPFFKIKGNQLTDHYYDTGVYEIEWQKAKSVKTNHPYMGRMSFPENEARPSRTIMATRSASTREAILYQSEAKRKGDGEYRLPTVREAASIMGFPLSYVFFGSEATKWRQIGNAVCPQMAFALANRIREMSGMSIVERPAIRPAPVTDDITFLDDHLEKTFDKPPRKSSKALFRSHPVKSGNMTVALTNKDPLTGDSRWTAYAFMGTGKNYRAIQIERQHKEEARKLLEKENPDFLRMVASDSSISYIERGELEKLNGTYHYDDATGEHPLSRINKISGHIKSCLSGRGDYPVATTGSALEEVKTMIPVSQIMALYAVGIILHPETRLEKIG
jgi:DNA (cytosine-5)-methyltransferase 1